MKNVVSLTASNLCGLFELSRTGTVLYSRYLENNELLNTIPHLVGLNFFDQIADLGNIADLRRLFKNFVGGSNFTDKFVFDCWSQGNINQIKILMVRAYENNYSEPGSIVILDIRKNVY